MASSSSSSSSSFTYLPPPGTTTYCIQSCHAANATIATAIVKVAYSITLFQNLFCLLVISCTNIAIFFFSLFLLSSIYCIVLLRAAVCTALLCSLLLISRYSDIEGSVVTGGRMELVGAAPTQILRISAALTMGMSGE